MTVQLSTQQAAVVEWVKSGRGSAFGEAVAGAGKTTTALMAAAEMNGSVAVMAYNAAAAKEFQAKAAKLGLQFDNRVRFGTCHSFGLSGWRRAYPEVKFGPEAARLKKDKTVEKFRAVQSPEALDHFVLKLVSLAKNYAIGLNGQIDDRKRYYDIVDHHDLAYELEESETITDWAGADRGPVTIDKGIDLAIRTLKYHRELGPKLIDFDDMIWLPVVTGVKLWQNDWVVGDEWQDANIARRMLARKMLKPSGRALFIGDRHQAIYGFTGADSDSITNTIREFSCCELPMTVTFRCPKAVVEEARKVVSHIEAHDAAPEGKVEYTEIRQLIGPASLSAQNRAIEQGVDLNEDKQYDLQSDDAILCRLTKPLVALAFQLIKRGVACHVEGRDIGAGLIKLLERFKSAKTLTNLRDRLTAYAEREVAKLTAKGRETQAEALMDRVETIFVIMDSQPPATGVDDVRRRIQSMFVDGDNEAKKTLTLSTVHRSKGREWDRVFILGRNAYMPSPWARQDWQLIQEVNLQYVAITRAIKELIYINVVG